MAVRNVDPSNSFEQWRVETNEIATDAGDVSTLTTTATNLTAAVNENDADITSNATAITTKEDIGVATAMAIALGG
jgi:hypothetical protein